MNELTTSPRITIVRPGSAGQTETEYLEHVRECLNMSSAELSAHWEPTNTFLAGISCCECGVKGVFFEYGFWCETCEAYQTTEREIYRMLRERNLPLP